MTTTAQLTPRPAYPAWFNQAIVPHGLETDANTALHTLIEAARHAAPAIAAARDVLHQRGEELDCAAGSLEDAWGAVHDATGLGAIYRTLTALGDYCHPDSEQTVEDLEQRLSDPHRPR